MSIVDLTRVDPAYCAHLDSTVVFPVFVAWALVQRSLSWHGWLPGFYGAAVGRPG